MSLTTQQLADYETLLLVFYQTARELKFKTSSQPSGKQVLFWLDTYGYAAAEQGIRQGLGGFMKKVPTVATDKDAIYLVNYLNTTIKSIKASFEPARPTPGEDSRAR